MKTKPQLSFWQIWNMSFGFLGIQFGFALQGGFMSSIFVSLGASKDEIPLLWIAAPLTGLIVQPIIGYFSDRTWHPRLGRRRPFFLIGAVLASIVLFFVPHSPTLWVAAGCLWLLDASINISMEPFRALVADKLSNEQRTYGFVVQTLVIGVGTWIASNLPWFVDTVLQLPDEASTGVPLNVKIAFAVGAFVFLASILITVFTTKEYSPEEMAEYSEESEVEASEGFQFNPVMAKLAVVQFFSWFAFFTMWNFATLALVDHVFEAPSPDEKVYNMQVEAEASTYNSLKVANEKATTKAGAYMGTYGLSSMAFALILTFFSSKRKVNRRWVHALSLAIGAAGFFSMKFVTSPEMLHLSYACIGVAWGSILSMPYAMLSSSIKASQMGLAMGIFNIFIVIPQIVAALGGITLTAETFLGEDLIHTMTLAGFSLVLASLFTLVITERYAVSD
ncbi:MAG: MFS transporter [Bacteroidota bacterium]|nr:MFS transporter [Bacteroidota bacterium]